MTDSYLTIVREARCEVKIKGSRFIGEALTAAGPDEAVEKLNAVRKREFNATHHCYAYVVGVGSARKFKYSDAGEPSGTAGKPIYDALDGAGVTNTLCVVTRYFGGTKLGTGGLARAYGDAAARAINEAGVVERYLCTEFTFTLDFPHYDRWLKKVHELGATVTASDFSDRVTVRAKVRNSLAERLSAAFVELTAGKGAFEKIRVEQE